MSNPARHISRLTQGHCTNCGHELTGISAKTADQPKPGDVLVCGYCSHIMEWNGDKLVELSDEAMKDIAGDADVLAAVDFAAAFQATYPKDRCLGCGVGQIQPGRIRCERCGRPLVFPAGGPR
jgi:DNA-directed RNA polymerase subunit RPC12/RpoP